MPEARGQVEALDGSLEVLQSDLNVPTEVGRGSKASSMPKAGLDVPLNGPRQEKWWYEVRAGSSFANGGMGGSSVGADGALDRRRLGPLQLLCKSTARAPNCCIGALQEANERGCGCVLSVARVAAAGEPEPRPAADGLVGKEARPGRLLHWRAVWRGDRRLPATAAELR